MSSLLSKEVSHFKTLATSWQNPNGPLYTLHRLNPTRLAYVRKFVRINKGSGGNSQQSGTFSVKEATLAQQQNASSSSDSAPYQTYYPPLVQNCLDIGSGAGIATKNLANWCQNVTALEPTTELIENAPKLPNVTYVNGLIEDLASKSENHGKFDLVCALEVVEHVADLDLFVKGIADVLQEDGTLIMSTLNRTSMSYWLGIVGAEYLSGIVPVGTHDWSQFVKPEELMNALARHGIEVQDVVGVRFNPLTQAFWLDYDDVRVNYMLAARKVKKGGKAASEVKQEEKVHEAQTPEHPEQDSRRRPEQV